MACHESQPMKAVVQRVSSASVTVDGQTTGEIGQGFMVLVGVKKGDTTEDAAYLARKIARLRVFSDEAGKMNLDLSSVGGAVLAISQFTLYADTRGGNRPSFIEAATPDDGRRLYRTFCELLRDAGCTVAEGIFQADMKVALVNDGPVTVVLDSSERLKP
jgi:D-tyrosyl-tRNA(Tyr) deacylase